ncbi:MAG: 50S ribosomal protein L14e [Nanoarchaeota archaeon]|nr:50S ribosomal protein L14e [Nanoarchaeota archaeon]|tara:strand:+ start:355 stop:804 length:450 start_codon:yes stop_codon:yes gene_type:complete
MVFSPGRMVVKLAGRDAGRKGVVVEVLDTNYVMIDGNVRRKKVNVKHLEPLHEVIEVKDKASHSDVKKVFEKLGLAVWDKKSKSVTEKPKKGAKVVEEKEEKKEKKSKKVKKSEVKEAQEAANVEEATVDKEAKVAEEKPTELAEEPAE